jgi:hypothetical protein
MAGLVVVGVGIEDTRRRFERQTLFQAIKVWFARLRNAWRLPPVTGSGAVTVTPGTAAIGLVGHAPTVTTNTEQRLSALEKAVDELQKRVSESVGKLTETLDNIRSELVAEVAARQRGDAEVRSLVEDQSAGGLHWEVIGLVWLVVGTLIGW